MLLTETLFIALTILSVYYTLKIFPDMQLRDFLLAGGFWSLSTLVRPTAILVILLFALILFVRKVKLKHIFIFLIPTVIFVGGWSLRNSLTYDTPLFLTNVGTWNLWVGNNIDATGGFEKTSEQIHVRRSHHALELSSIGAERYFEFLIDHPFRFIELQFRKTVMYFSLIRPTGFWSYLKNIPTQQFATLSLSGLGTAILFITGIAGSALLFIRRRDIVAKIILLFAILQPLAVIPIIVETRYRYSLFPFLAVFGAFFIVSCFKKREDILYKIFGWVFIVFISITAYDAIYHSDILFSRLNTFI
jgi:hypothetical protein